MKGLCPQPGSTRNWLRGIASCDLAAVAGRDQRILIADDNQRRRFNSIVDLRAHRYQPGTSAGADGRTTEPHLLSRLLLRETRSATQSGLASMNAGERPKHLDRSIEQRSREIPQGVPDQHPHFTQVRREAVGR